MLLCDWAEELGGKLYIMGGGWNRLAMTRPTMSMSLAVLLHIPWDQANRKHPLCTRLVNEDGESVVNDGEPVQIKADIEVGRPPGMRQGEAITAPLVFRFDSIPASTGRFEWWFEQGEQRLAIAAFTVVPGGTL